MDDGNNEPKAQKETCASCGAKLKGDYCRKCGEKKIIPARDFSLSKFLNQMLWHLVHFDSKFLQSFWYLFSKPGFLTLEWTAGRRIAYMKPLQLFVVASVLFYFFLPTTAAHFTTPGDLQRGYQTHSIFSNTFQYNFAEKSAEKATKLQMEEAALKNIILTEAAQQSKTWLFVIIPFWGLFVYAFFRQKMPWLAPHLIFAMHGLTFYIFLDLSIHAILAMLGLSSIGRNIFLILMATFPVYQLLAAHRVYGFPWRITLLKTIGIASGFVVLILLYRQAMTILTLEGL